MFKKILLAVGAAFALTIPVFGQNGANGYTGAWLPYWGDALGAANNGIVIATNSAVITTTTNSPLIHIQPNAFITFFPSFNLATNSATASSSNVTFYFSSGPGLYTNNLSSVVGSTNMTTSTFAVTLTAGLTGTTNAIAALTINPTNIIGKNLQFLGASTAATNVGGVVISNMPYFFWAQQ